MPFPTTLPAAILETVLTRLAALFLTGAGGNLTAARDAAAHMLAAYHPRTTDELRLAEARIAAQAIAAAPGTLPDQHSRTMALEAV
jgi:hypothetical protein